MKLDFQKNEAGGLRRRAVWRSSGRPRTASPIIITSHNIFQQSLEGTQR